ncbi:26s proteasome non-ATPase regulatory subunit 4-like protein, partial [Chrysochromulina tobinii]
MKARIITAISASLSACTMRRAKESLTLPQHQDRADMGRLFTGAFPVIHVGVRLTAAMVLEATFIVIDNSDWMRNSDFAPSRLDAQQDAVNLLAAAKTQSNPENTVGVLTMAGKGVDVRVAMTSDVGKVLAQSHGAQVCGEINLSAGLQVAGLALKHRQNKNQRQRIIVFVGSPVKEDEKELVKLGKKLKKNSVALDIINFGEEAENTPKLEALLNAVNSDDNSHLVTVPPGPHVLSDILLSSPIVQGE